MDSHEEIPSVLSQLLRSRRLAVGLSLRDLEIVSDINRATLSRVENGKQSLQPDNLAALARALALPLADLYEAAGYPLPQALPSLRPYLRRAYNVPEAAVDEIEQYLQQVIAPYGMCSPPQNGEDELPE